jgi:uncharacterized protein YceK
MLRKATIAAALGVCTALSGCASIVHSGPRSISVSSTPAGATVSIYDRKDTLVEKNTTPFVAQLSTKYSYFQGQRYRLVFELPGHAPAEVKLEPTVSAWYFANLVFGGAIGMLIVDPITGAMFNLSPDKIEQPLSPSQAQLVRNGTGFLVVLASQTTEGERAAMVRVN